MKRLIATLALILSVTSANAGSRIYKVSDTSLVQNKLTEIKKLGLVVLDDKQAAPAGAIDFGAPKNVKLENLDVAKETKANSLLGVISLWGILATDALRAWNVVQGDGVVVAVIDTGVQANHPEIAPNMWVNTGEIPGNGEDDDFNGYIDDINGWDFKNNIPSNKDNQFHGTHIAGTIAAVKSDKFSGIAHKAKIMSVAFMNNLASGTDIEASQAIIYATDMGAKIINCSWTFPGISLALESAVAYAQSRGVLVVAAAGNANKDTDLAANQVSPASLNLGNIISVAATSSILATKASFSNFGKTSVELAAPGVAIRSLNAAGGAAGGYIVMSGTSVSAAHVSGAAALVYSKTPSATFSDVRAKLLSSAYKVTTFWKNKSVTEGILNAYEAVK